MKTMTTAQLTWTMKDLTTTILNQEEMVKAGMSCPKLGKYWTEFLKVEAELKRRGV